MWPKIRETLAIFAVMLTLVGLPLAIYAYHKSILVSRHGKNVQIIDLYASAASGKWIAELVNGFNYWWKRFDHSDTLKVEVGKLVVLRLTSTDVLHSFAIPGIRELRKPIDIEAGMWKAVQFTLEEKDELSFLCWQYCSDKHNNMHGEIVGVDGFVTERLVSVGE